ncbi:unnamed protein product [Bacillus phage SPP1]|uniref:Bacteriophage SPP1 complete nucleotide sequence n=1 Tax=Bacillus phage SPP1 TaxID=10724 RepID=O48492_BPSPP|nr:hypothetical protein SPP1p077 [Bacillus phage SPP1]CAA66492.1 unnamed protein product [Bacillus phage SPP1]
MSIVLPSFAKGSLLYPPCPPEPFCEPPKVFVLLDPCELSGELESLLFGSTNVMFSTTQSFVYTLFPSWPSKAPVRHEPETPIMRPVPKLLAITSAIPRQAWQRMKSASYCPVVGSFLLRLTAIIKFTTAVPLFVCLSSGSAASLPTKLTLFICFPS